MGNYFKTTYLFARTQLKRGFRDPLTVLILMGLPVVLLVVFGAFIKGDSDITLRTAIISHSDKQFAKEFEEGLGKVEVLKINKEVTSIDAAKEKMNASELDTIIEVGQIVAAVTNGIIDGYNQQLVGAREEPLTIERTPLSITEAKPIHYIFSVFMGMALLMVGIFGVANVLPADKKARILRRLHVTPLRASQVSIGTMLCFAVIGSIMAIAMTVLAIVLFGMDIKGGIANYVVFALLGLVLMLGLGLAIGGIAKNTTQAEVIGQVVFFASLALGGVWLPTALMPEILQGVSALMPLTPVVEGLRQIVAEGAGLVDLYPLLAVMIGWIIVVYIVGFKTFRWE
jgi:ABC-2 type transport system permease protein